MMTNERTTVRIEDATVASQPGSQEGSPESASEPLSGVFRVRPQPSVIERIDALAARMRSAASLLSQNRPRDGRDD